ncbi:MAG: hypothetical protein QM703_18405 [Gemmatales bacterium]
MAKSIRIPSYRRHSSGQARVTISGKDQLLGTYGSEESKATVANTFQIAGEMLFSTKRMLGPGQGPAEEQDDGDLDGQQKVEVEFHNCWIVSRGT